jgi:hypothetical protein
MGAIGTLIITFNFNPSTKIVQQINGTEISTVWTNTSGSTWTAEIGTANISNYMIIYY